jgi:hypothetical protein
MPYTVALDGIYCTASNVAEFAESWFNAFQGQTATLFLENVVATLLTMSGNIATLHEQAHVGPFHY